MLQPQSEPHPQHGNGRPHRGQGEGHGAKAAGTEQHHQGHRPHHGEHCRVGVVRPAGQLARQRSLQVRGMQFNPGLIAVHRRGAAVLQTRSRRPQHHHPALEHGRVCAAFQHLQHRQRWHRTSPAEEGNQRAALAVNRKLERPDRQVLCHRLAVKRRLLPEFHRRLLSCQQGEHAKRHGLVQHAVVFEQQRDAPGDTVGIDGGVEVAGPTCRHGQGLEVGAVSCPDGGEDPHLVCKVRRQPGLGQCAAAHRLVVVEVVPQHHRAARQGLGEDVIAVQRHQKAAQLLPQRGVPPLRHLGQALLDGLRIAAVGLGKDDVEGHRPRSVVVKHPAHHFRHSVPRPGPLAQLMQAGLVHLQHRHPRRALGLQCGAYPTVINPQVQFLQDLGGASGDERPGQQHGHAQGGRCRGQRGHAPRG